MLFSSSGLFEGKNANNKRFLCSNTEVQHSSRIAVAAGRCLNTPELGPQSLGISAAKVDSLCFKRQAGLSSSLPYKLPIKLPTIIKALGSFGLPSSEKAVLDRIYNHLKRNYI